MLEAIGNSLIIAAVVSVAATVIGTLAAYAMWKRRSPLLANSLYLSLLTPEIVTGVSLLVFFQFFFRFLHVQLGMHTVILAHISFSIPFSLIVILARLRNFDPSLEEAALDLGGNEWHAFRYVTLPNLAPAIVASLLLCFVVSFDDYVITSLVAGVNSETLPMVIYSLARRGVSPAVNALSAMVTVGIGLFIVLAERLQRSRGDRL
jgi:spermidine/putrescine transport system permease protein